MISAPSETRCRAMPAISMNRNVNARTSGIETATAMPARTPSARKLTPRTMTTAWPSDVVKPRIAVLTTVGWLATCVRLIPIGRSFSSPRIVASMFWPSCRMSPPDAMEMAMPIAGLPLTRKRGWGGFTVPRTTLAISPSRTKPDVVGMFNWRMVVSSARLPDT
ncbi:hypothetical protein FQZ97_1097820 [compost metagenome]